MPVNTKDILRGSILCFEGQAQQVKAVSEFIMFENRKEWIGGSLINGEPLSELWLERFGFEYRPDTMPKRWNKKMFGQNSTWHLYESDGVICFSPFEWNYTIKLEYVHQLQLLHFTLTGEQLTVPKLKPIKS